MKIIKNRKDSFEIKKKVKKGNKKWKESNLYLSIIEIIAIIGYLFLIILFGGILFFKILIKKESIYQISFILISAISIISYFIVSFSDPGKLTEDFKTTLNEKSIKSFEDKVILINIKYITKQVKSNSASNIEDFEFKDDPTNNQIEYDSKEHLGRTSIKSDKDKIYIKSNLNETNINLKNKYRSKNHLNRISENKELQIDIEETNLDSNHKKYFTSKNKMRIKLEFDQNLNKIPIANTVSSAYDSNYKQEVKLKNPKYFEIPKCDSHGSKVNCDDNLNISKDIHIEMQEINNDLSSKEKDINEANEIKMNNENHIRNEDVVVVDDLKKRSEIDLSTFNIFCSNCCIDVPLRAKHCKTCNKCFATFDHHCSWIANCIGEKNKRLFIIFLTIHTLNIAYAIILSILNFQKSKEASEWFSKNALIFVNTLIIILFFTFVLSLLVFQIQILLVNQSTWENYSWHKINYMRKLSKSQKSPFNRGIINNISMVFCFKRYYVKKKESYLNDHIDWTTMMEVKI